MQELSKNKKTSRKWSESEEISGELRIRRIKTTLFEKQKEKNAREIGTPTTRETMGNHNK